MAMKTLVKNCPFCKKVVEQRAYASWGRKPSEEDKWLFGTPLKLCPHCGKLYVDKDIQELAITGPRKQDTVFVGPASLRIALMGVALGGFTTVIILLLLFGSLIMISLGIIGYYIARIYEEVKGRPKYIIAEKL